MDTPKEASTGAADLQKSVSQRGEVSKNDSASTTDDGSRASSRSPRDGEEEDDVIQGLS